MTAQGDGATIVIEVSGQCSRFSVGNGPSVLVSQLVAGYAD